MLNFVFLTTLLSTTSFNFSKLTGPAFNLRTFKSSTFVFKIFYLVETLTNFLMPNLSTSAFKAIRSFIAAKSDASTPVAWSNSFLVG